MPIKTQDVVAVATSPTQIAAPTGGSVTPTVVYNAGAETMYLGGDDVATTTGIPLAAGQWFGYDLLHGDVLYGVVAASTENARVMQGRS